MAENKESIQASFRFTDPRQERIYRRLLQRIGPGPAASYVDAGRLMSQQEPMPTTSHLVGHLLRDIESAMRDVLEMLLDPEERKTIKKNRKDKHKAELLLILKALKISEDNPVAKTWLDLIGKENSEALHRRAHRRDLSSPRPIDKDFREFWERMESILDAVLDQFETRFLDLFKILDGLLDKPSPNEKDIILLKNHIPNSLVTRGYFFDRLTSKAWLQPLRHEGFFKEPPAPIQNVDERTINFPPWPESGYIARMVRISEETYHSFRSKVTTDFVPNLPAISEQIYHPL